MVNAHLKALAYVPQEESPVSLPATLKVTPMPGAIGFMPELAAQPHGVTMNSKENAELTGKDHAHVLRDIRVMLGEIKDDPNLDYVKISKDSRGYTSEIQLPRDLTETLVTGYSIPLPLAAVRRWHELEAQVAKPALMNLNNLASLRGLLLG